MLNVDKVLDAVPNNATGLNEEQFIAFLKMFHVAMRQIRLCYELGLETGNDALDDLTNGLGSIVEEFEIEFHHEREVETE